MLVLGFDPGTALTGYGLVRKQGSSLNPLEYGVIRTSSKDRLPTRLAGIYRGIQELLDRYQPDAVAVEELFFNSNVKTYSSVSQARGAILLTVALRDIEIYEYTPLQVKQAVVGYGRAEKNQVQRMVKSILRMEDVVHPDDAADALAIAICHIHSYRGEGLK